MNRIFAGMVFIFIEFNININTSQIGLFPDFVGYIFMAQGLTELSQKSRRFSAALPFATVMAVLTGIDYVVKLMGLSAGTTLGYFVWLAFTCISLYISYNIVMGIKEMEKTELRFLGAEGLFRWWMMLFIWSVVSFGLFLIPALWVVIAIAGFIFSLCYLLGFNSTRKLYYGNV